MPVFDFPLEKLKQYQGINPRPDDFDTYWDESLAEMHALDSQIDLVPSKTLKSSVAECFDLYFTGTGGARIHAKYLRPKHLSGPCPAVLSFHGYTGDCGDWADKLSWVSEGFCVAALDCRGQGGLSQDNLSIHGNTHHGHIIRGLDDPDPKKLLFRHIFLDTAQLARIVMSFSEVDEYRVAAHGGSQGGALTLACAALEPSVRLAAPTYPFLSDYRRVWEMDLAKGAYSELSTYFRKFDPRHERVNETFTKLGYIDVQNLAPRIEAKVLMLTGLMDTICPPSTQFAAYNKIRSEKDMVIYPDFMHEFLPDANDIIFNFIMELRP